MQRPNILFIMSDDHSTNAIGSYPSHLTKHVSTPNIDAIGSEGAVLDCCFCTNSICTPSRATILTGQYSHTNGVKTLYDALSEHSLTFPELFQENGYHTAVIGKWHLHSKPRGFDHYDILGYPWQQGKYFDPQFLDSNTDWGDEMEKDVASRCYYGTEVKGYVTDIITDKCLRWLETREKNKPFMLLCHHKAPHDEFEYHPRYEQLFDGVEIREPESMYEDKIKRCQGSRKFGITVSEANPRRNMVETMARADYPTGPLDIGGLDQEQRTHAAYQKLLKDYLRTVKGIDDSVGHLISYLKANDLYENTIIVYTSDQGMLLGEHDYTDKRWIFEESLRMPFLIRVPGKVTSGKRVRDLVSNVDFAPTLLEYAGIEVPVSMEGQSFCRNLEGCGQIIEGQGSIYYRYWLHMTHCDTPAHFGLRTRDYKLIFYYGLPLDATGALPEPTPWGWELYDLRIDPLEMNNVYDAPKYKPVIEQLKQALFDKKQQLGDTDDKYPELLKRIAAERGEIE